VLEIFRVFHTLPWQKWQFLCHLADHHAIALHGSGDPNIALFEPRQFNDLSAFGNLQPPPAGRSPVVLPHPSKNGGWGRRCAHLSPPLKSALFADFRGGQPDAVRQEGADQFA
jgi:hypothetical protein